ncbi:MAG: Uma2 family endonuclease [Deltaproteobacteria bacterium]|nr:Uma2 family endonuclease [Deltaproteobacteria bacterium]
MLDHDPTGTAPCVFPRAPSSAAWAAMTPAQRQATVAALPNSVTELELSPPEGDRHSSTKNDAKDALEGFFRRRGRGLYVGCDLTVYYPDRPRFCPDVLVAFDVDGHPREKWVVDLEGKGLDWVMEVHVGGDRSKDIVRHPDFYASLGIPEYFVVDRSRDRIYGWRLPSPNARAYKPILAQAGHYTSEVLGLELALEHGQIRFFMAGAPLPLTRELLARLTETVAELDARFEEESRLRLEATRLREEEATRREEEARLREEEARLREEEARLREQAEAKVAELLAELESLRGKR